MKYTRLTKEQLEELNQEFINFLATQSITAEEWKDIKEQKPKVAEEELDVFSDLVWEGVLSKVEYLENIAPQHMYLFKVDGSQLRLIGLKIKSDNIDLTTKEGFAWLRENLMSDDVELFNADKTLESDKNAKLFELIVQGSSITKGELFKYLDDLIG
jgi:cag pathogenicity island protein 24